MERKLTDEVFSYIPAKFWILHTDLKDMTLRICPDTLKAKRKYRQEAEDIFEYIRNGIACTYYESINTIEFSLIDNKEDELAIKLKYEKHEDESHMRYRQAGLNTLIPKVSTIEIISTDLMDLYTNTDSWTQTVKRLVDYKKVKIKNCILFEYDDLYSIMYDRFNGKCMKFNNSLNIRDLEIIDCAFTGVKIKGSITKALNTEHLKIKGLLAPKLTTIEGIFKDSPNLKSAQLIDCKFDSVANVTELFKRDEALEKLDITNSFSKSPIQNCDSMFDGCERLREIKGLESMNLTYVNFMQYTFRNCINLKRINLIKLGEKPDFNIIGISKERLEAIIMEKQYLLDISGIFMNCKRLKEINLENIHNITRIYNISNIFTGLPKDCEIKLTQPIKALRYNSKNEDEFELYYENTYEPLEGTDKLSLKEFSLFEQYFELNNKSIECVTYAITDTSNVSSIDLETLNVIPVELDNIDDIQKELAKSIIFNEVIYQRSNCVLAYSEESNTLKIIAKEIKKIENFKR